MLLEELRLDEVALRRISGAPELDSLLATAMRAEYLAKEIGTNAKLLGNIMKRGTVKSLDSRRVQSADATASRSISVLDAALKTLSDVVKGTRRQKR
jgi:hypothetical protein